MITYEKKPVQKNTDILLQKKSRINSTGIPSHMKDRFESISGLSFDNVKIHFNSPEPERLDALAYSFGNHVYIAPGQEKCLPHELGHVAQHKWGLSRRDSFENGLPISKSSQIEHHANHIAQACLSGQRLLKRTEIKSVMPVVMRTKKRPTGFELFCRDMEPTFKKVHPRLSSITINRKLFLYWTNLSPQKRKEYIKKKKKALIQAKRHTIKVRVPPMYDAVKHFGLSSAWKPGKRRHTAFGILHKSKKQGPHTQPFIGSEVFRNAAAKEGLPLKNLVGTRIIPYPKTAVKIVKKIGDEAVAAGSIKKADMEAAVTRYKAAYQTTFDAKQYSELMELSPLQTRCHFASPTHSDMAGKGERRGNAANDLLGIGTSTVDYGNESPYVTKKTEKRFKAHQKIAQTITQDDYDFSQDSEFTSSDEE